MLAENMAAAAYGARNTARGRLPRSWAYSEGFGALGQSTPPGVPVTTILNPGDQVTLTIQWPGHRVPYSVDYNLFQTALRNAPYQVLSFTAPPSDVTPGNMFVSLGMLDQSPGRGSLTDLIGEVAGIYQTIFGVNFDPNYFAVSQYIPAGSPQVLQTLTAPPPPPPGSLTDEWKKFWEGLGLGATTGALLAGGIILLVLSRR